MDDNTTKKQQFTAGQLARRAGVSSSYIARLCRQGKINAVKAAGAVWIIEREDAMRYLEGKKLQ